MECYLWGMLGGVVWNLANILLCKGIGMMGNAIGFPLCVGLGMVCGAIVAYVQDKSNILSHITLYYLILCYITLHYIILYYT